MARNDYVEKASMDAPSADGLADDLKQLLDQLAVQLSDAEQRHSETVQGMQERVATLTDRASVAKADLPENCDAAFGRVENAMSALADRLASVEPAQRQADDGKPDDESAALPDEVRDDIRRAMSLDPLEPINTPPMFRAALATNAAASTVEQAEPAHSTGEIVGNIVDTGAATMATQPAASREAFDKGWDNSAASAASSSQRLFRTPFDASQAPGRASAGVDQAWLDARFADIAGRIEYSIGKLDPHNSLLTLGERFGQLERRFDVALQNLSGPAGGGVAALQSLEKQITDIFTELGRAQQQLGRLDAIEKRLTELRQSPTDQQMEQLVGAMKPTDQQLAAIAEVATERVVERLRQTAPEGAAASIPGSSGLGALTTLIQEFIGEQRQGDALTAEALDTMQLAMQHLIDRVEAIEAAQSSGHEELMRVTNAVPARRADRSREPLELGVRETNLTPSAVSSGSDELPSLAVISPSSLPPTEPELPKPQLQVPTERRYDHDRPALQQPSAPETLTASRLDRDDDLQPQPTSRTSGGTDRTAYIAMARRAAEKAAREQPSTAAPASAASPMGAAGWLKRLTGKTASGDDAPSSRRPRLLVFASFLAFLLASYWMMTGTGLRSYVVGHVSNFQMPFAKAERRNVVPAPDQKVTRAPAVVPDETAGGDIPTADSPQRKPFPSAGRVAEGVGIVVDDSHRTSDPARMIRAREQVQLASLSAKLGQDRPPPSTMTSALPAPTGSLTSAMSRTVEMPPALIGPLSLRHAAANGDSAAQMEIAARFAEGKGVPQDFTQAANWYQRAATHGLAAAQYRLGQLYERGLGVVADPSRARIWYGRAAEQGNVQAMHNLASLSAGHASGNPDYSTAIQWFSEAANRGLADSQFNLGVLYERGLGTPESLTDAYKWYSLAARSGDKDAIRRRDVLRIRLDTASRDAVDKVIIDWRAKPTAPTANDPRNAGLAGRVQPTAKASQ